MTKAEAKKEIARIAEAKGGKVSPSGKWVDLPNDPNVVGFGVMVGNKDHCMIVSIPR